MDQHVAEHREVFEWAIFDAVPDAVTFIHGELRLNLNVDVGEVFQS